MELTEYDFTEKYGTLCKQCNRNCLLPCEKEVTSDQVVIRLGNEKANSLKFKESE